MPNAPEIFKLPIRVPHLIIIHFYNIWFLVMTLVQVVDILGG